MFPTIDQERHSQMNRSVSGVLDRNNGFQKNTKITTPNGLNNSHSGIDNLKRNFNIHNRGFQINPPKTSNVTINRNDDDSNSSDDNYRPYESRPIIKSSNRYAAQVSQAENNMDSIKHLKSQNYKKYQLEVIEAQIEQNRIQKMNQKQRDHEVDLLILGENKKQIQQQKAEDFKKKLQKSRYYHMLKQNYEMFKEKKKSTREIEIDNNGSNTQKAPYKGNISPTGQCKNGNQSSNNIATFNRGMVNLNLSYEPTVQKSTMNLSKERTTTYLPQSWTEEKSPREKLENKRRSIEMLRTALHEQLQEKKKIQTQARRKDEWYFRTAVQADVNNLSNDESRKSFVKMKEKKNLEFICLQMKERRKETLKHKGHMKIRVKIDDDYRSSKRIQSRNKAIQQALRGFTQQRPARTGNFNRLG
ncbi:unnamed protein product [Moneuplotes crassus]|uniref:Uncharacterized protein n=1 Tax=Euplotes crassus TaxID=5936 RepID=A0AAD1UGE4_EUPCR|nr:unnamed protein product [Moneuplotes crassus]